MFKLLFLLLFSTSVIANDSIQYIEDADRIRFPKNSFQVDIDVENFTRNEFKDKSKFRVLNKGHDNSLVMTLEPASDRGQILLMKNIDLWLYAPSVSQPVRLPLAQKLTGQVANGDLARANFAGDYNSIFADEEVIDGVKYLIFELSAAKKGVTYSFIKYWIEADTRRPYKAEFYTKNGRILKTCHYTEYALLGGVMRPTKMIIQDGIKVDDKTVMVYSNMVERDLDDKVFTKDYLKKLQ
jgi:hypothetical protein